MPGTKLYVGGIPYSATEAALGQLFSRFGRVSAVSIVSDRMTGRSKGFGFVEFADPLLAASAAQSLDGSEFQGRRLTVNEARPLEPRVSRYFDGSQSPETRRDAGMLADRLRQVPIDRELGRVVTPIDAPNTTAADLVSDLQLPDEYSGRLVRVSNLPVEILRRVMEDPRAMHGLTPRQFEEFIAELIAGIGFRDVVLTPASGDGGKDIVARLEVHGIPITFFLECKKYSPDHPVEIEVVRSFLGVVAQRPSAVNKGILVTTSRLTKGGRELVASEARLDAREYDGIMAWIDTYVTRSPAS